MLQFAGVPGPFGRGHFGPTARVPFARPRFDPIGPLPNQRFRPGRGGGMWDSSSDARRSGFGGFGPRLF